MFFISILLCVGELSITFFGNFIYLLFSPGLTLIVFFTYIYLLEIFSYLTGLNGLDIFLLLLVWGL